MLIGIFDEEVSKLGSKEYPEDSLLSWKRSSWIAEAHSYTRLVINGKLLPLVYAYEIKGFSQ